MKTTGDKFIFAGAVVAFGIATWFAFRTPTPTPLPADIIDATSSAGATTTTVVTNAAGINDPKLVAAAVRPKNNYIPIKIITPTSSAEWVIGEDNVITWSKAAGVTGQMYLINAASGTVAGWVEQNLAPTQTSATWDARELSLGATDPAEKDVSPGKYILRISFSSPEIPTVSSAPFSIVEPSTSAH